MKKTPFPVFTILLSLILLCVFSLFSVSCRKPEPYISSISPEIGAMGEILTINGGNFGDEKEESYVSIAGISPTLSSYTEWTNTRILVRVPEFGESGLVYVHAGKTTSNAALFSSRENMPQPIRGAEVGNVPRIVSVEPSSAAVGQAVTIRGQSFGASREGSQVLFAWAAEAAPAAPLEVSGPSSVAVSGTDFGYEAWNDREIRVRVPDGAVSGNLEIRTPRGNSLPVFFEVSGKPGNKTYKDKRSYAISYSVDIQVTEASNPNTLYLWMPLPKSSASQKDPILLSRSAPPFIENYGGAALYRLKDLSLDETPGVKLSYLVDVYAVETDIRPQSVRSLQSTLQSIYTAPSPLVPSADAGIVELAKRVTAREQNPYIKAERIYDWIIKEAGVGPDMLSGGVKEALDSGKADSYAASLLFCSLARASGVPALPVAGVLIDKNRRLRRHYWAEFWIDGFGWIPADPALGSGALDRDFAQRPDAAAYYFGSLDSQRITFSRGEARFSQMEARGRAASRQRDYALQSIWEEAAGGLESYSSLWSDIIITGVYAH